MCAFLIRLLMLSGSLFTPLFGPPSFAFVRAWGPVPVAADEGWKLLTADRCIDILGHDFGVEELRHVDTDWTVEKLWRIFRHRPYVVELFVDQNRLSAGDVLTTMKTLRSEWNPKKKVIFVFAFGRCTVSTSAGTVDD